MSDVIDEIAEAHLSNIKWREGFLSATCPFHGGGMEKNPSFWLNREDGNWGCFSCHVGGGSVEWLLKELGEPSSRVKQLVERAKEESKKRAPMRRAKQKRRAHSDFKGLHILPDELLGIYDFTPLELVEDGFDEELLATHQIGYDKNLDRITYPIRDLYGNLIGISGRQPDGQAPKYKVYEGWHVSSYSGERVPGELGEMFPKYSSDHIRDHLWLMHDIYNDLMKGVEKEVVVVEGYKATLWMRQCGWRCTTGLMGSSLSMMQARILRRTGAVVYMFLDANEAGRKGSAIACDKLASTGVDVREVGYDDFIPSTQPDDLEPEEIRPLFEAAPRIGGRHVRVASFQKGRQKTRRRKPVPARR
jgi:DNA primase